MVFPITVISKIVFFFANIVQTVLLVICGSISVAISKKNLCDCLKSCFFALFASLLLANSVSPFSGCRHV